MNLRQQGLIALGIIEYQSVLDHLDAMRRVGIVVSGSVLRQLGLEQELLIRQWVAVRGGAVTQRESVLYDVKTWGAEHMEELEQELEGRK